MFGEGDKPKSVNYYNNPISSDVAAQSSAIVPSIFVSNGNGGYSVTLTGIGGYFSSIENSFDQGTYDRIVDISDFLQNDLFRMDYYKEALYFGGMDFVQGNTIIAPSEKYKAIPYNNITGMSVNDWAYFAGYSTPDIAISTLGGYALSSLKLGSLSRIKNIEIPVYRVYGGGASRFGNYWTPISPNLYGRSYRYFAGLPNKNVGSFLFRGKVKLGDINNFGLARPLDGNFGRLVPEFHISESWLKVIWSPSNVKTLKFLKQWNQNLEMY